MSHTSKLDIKVKNVDTLATVCGKLGIVCTTGAHKLRLYDREHDVVASVTLPGWHYPVGVQANGDVIYDHFRSAPGTMKNLAKLTNEYTLSETERTARKARKRCTRAVRKRKPG